MARRRSMNRRSSRKSMNFTELDEDSELINRDNPLWWKNIESDITVRQSRRISYAETTPGILDTDSLVDPSELPDAWWDKLDKTNPNTPKRVSIRPTDTPAYARNDSPKSDDTDDASIKKRKVVLRTGSNKSEATDNFAKALVDSGADRSERLPTEKRKNRSDVTSDNGVVRKKMRKLERPSGRKSPEGSDKDTSGKTSDDSDVIVKARPLAFKKRSAKLASDLFDDILRNEPIAESSGINSVAEVSRRRSSRNLQSTTNPRAISLSANESATSVDNRSEILQQVSDRDQSGLMQPPKAKLTRKKRSSLSHAPIVNSDESDGDGMLKKVRPVFAKKNLQKVSLNPFDEILSQSLDDEDRELNYSDKRSRTSKHSATGDANDSNRRVDFQTSMRKSLRGEISHGQRIEQGEVEVSLTRERSLRSTSRNLSLRSTNQSRRSKSILPDSAYELPDRERSSPSFNRSISRSMDQSVPENNMNEPRKSNTPWRESRTRIFSDEDISVEDMGNASNDRQIFSQNMSGDDKVRRSRRSVQFKNKSLRSIEAVENNSEEEARDAEETNEKSSSSFLTRKSRTSRKSLAPADKSGSRIESDRSMGEDEPDDMEKTNPKSTSSLSKEKSQTSRKSLAPANESRTRIASDKSIGEGEPDDMERTNPKSTSSLPIEKLQNLRKSLAPANKSRTRIASDKSIGEDEPDEMERTNPKSTSTVSKEKSRTSKKSLAPENESRTRIASDEIIGENEPDDMEKTNPKSTSSLSNEKSRISRKSLAPANKSQTGIASDESIGENEPDDMERTNPKSTSSLSKEKSRTSRKSLAPANKSQTTIASDESIGENGPDDMEKTNPKSTSSLSKEKSRTSRKSLAPANKSRATIASDESIGENEPDDVEQTNRKSSRSILKNTSRLSTRNLTPSKKSLKEKEIVRNLSEAETEIAEHGDLESSSTSSNEIYDTSRKSLASTRKSQQLKSIKNMSGDETEIADEPDLDSPNSVMKDKSRTSRKHLVPTNESQRTAAYNRNNSEDESEDAENNDPKSSKSLLKEKSRISRNSLRPGNKSQPRKESEESSSEDNTDEVKEAERNLAPVNKSQRRIESHEGVNESENEEDENPNRKSSSSHIAEKSGKSRKSFTPTDNTEQTIESGVSLSEEEVTSTPMTNRSSNSQLGEKSQTSKKSVTPTIVSQPIGESGESISEQEAESSGSTNRSSLISHLEKSHVSVRSLGTTNKSRQIIETNKSINEDEDVAADVEKTNENQSNSHLKKKGDTSIRSLEPGNKSLQANKEIDASRESCYHLNLYSALEFARSVEKENVEDAERNNPTNDGKTSMRMHPSKNTSIERNTTDHGESSLPNERNQEKNERNQEKNVAPSANPLDKTPRFQRMNKPSFKKINKSSTNKTNVSESQKSIMEFFPSRFLQRSEHTRVHEIPTDFDKEKLISIKKKMDKIKSREIELLENDFAKRKKTDFSLNPITTTKKNLRTKKNVTSKPKKAQEVDAIVYKPPKLARPQLWATDRLYRHLWKRMEPTYEMATRRKSIKFVDQLAQVVSLTMRRKKYDNYKIQVEALMHEMARLGIIKTRNDFYDFCYDFLPYEFRVKVTPILLPGNVCSIPYNPKKLHTPILSGGEN